MKTSEVTPYVAKVFLRDIGRALEKKIYQNPETSFHWLAVIGENSLQKEPIKEWHFSDALIQIGVVHGNSEGCLVYVHAQPDRYQPGLLYTLFRIKFVCDAMKVFDDARVVYEFFESNEFFELTDQTCYAAQVLQDRRN